MVIKNHSGPVESIKTWENDDGRLEIKAYSETKLLWHFSEDDRHGIEKGDFYAPIYEKEAQGQTVRQSRHLFYLLNPDDPDGEAFFLEIGPDGYLNPTSIPTDWFQNDVMTGDILKLWRVKIHAEPPEDMIPLLQKL